MGLYLQGGEGVPPDRLGKVLVCPLSLPVHVPQRVLRLCATQPHTREKKDSDRELSMGGRVTALRGGMRECGRVSERVGESKRNSAVERECVAARGRERGRESHQRGPGGQPW